MSGTRKNHWESVYETKSPQEVSWTQEVPVSLGLISNLNVPKDAPLIDIGGGDSNLVDYLLDEGYQDITVLDISQKAIERAKIRLGKRAENIHWIISDIVDFRPERKYSLWHDRATFHFLTTDPEIKTYLNLTKEFAVAYLIIGTFSEHGPLKCSGLEITQYSDAKIKQLFLPDFKAVESFTHDHITPFCTTQNFRFTSFSKID